MKTLICGNIKEETFMKHCLVNNILTQHEQMLVGYNWSMKEDIVFTNNDHFLNGVRLSVKDGKLNPENLLIIFVKEDGIATKEILSDGSIQGWEDGFFDELEKSLMLLMWGKE